MTQAKWIVEQASAAPWGTPGSNPCLVRMPSWMAPRNVDPSIPPPEAPREAAPSIPVEAPREPDVVVSPYPPLPVFDARLDALSEENAELKLALDAAVAELTALRSRITRELEPQIVRLALTVGEKVAGLALDAQAEPALAWVGAGLEALADAKPIVISVGESFASRLDELAPRVHGVRIELDRSLPRWGCIVRGEHARVDVGLSNRVAAVAEALGVESSESEGS